MVKGYETLFEGVFFDVNMKKKKAVKVPLYLY